MAMAVLVVAVLCVHSTEAKEGPRCNNGLGSLVCNNGLGSLGCNNGLGCKTGQDCVPPQGGQTGRPECRVISLISMFRPPHSLLYSTQDTLQ